MLALLLVIILIIVVGRTVFMSLRRGGRSIPVRRIALIGFGLIAMWWIVTRGHFGLSWPGVIAVYLLASVIAGSIMQIGSAVGKITSIPTGTLAFAGIDAVILAAMTGSQYSGFASAASTAWAVAFGAWLISLIGRMLGAPSIARRRAEADEAIAHMNAAERAAADEVL